MERQNKSNKGVTIKIYKKKQTENTRTGERKRIKEQTENINPGLKQKENDKKRSKRKRGDETRVGKALNLTFQEKTI